MPNSSPRQKAAKPSESKDFSAEKPVLRTQNGKFVQGSRNLNPGGRPPTDRELVKAARSHTVEAIEIIANIMLTARRDSDRLKAAEILLDRGHGKAPQIAHLTVDVDGRPQDLSLEALQSAAAEIVERVRAQTVIVDALPAEEGAFRALPAPPVDSAEPGATTLAPEPGKSS